MRRAGLSDRLICLGAVWRFARTTERTLVADWRRSVYSLDQAESPFPLCFEPLTDLAGVPFIGDERVTGLRLPKLRHPTISRAYAGSGRRRLAENFQRRNPVWRRRRGPPTCFARWR